MDTVAVALPIVQKWDQNMLERDTILEPEPAQTSTHFHIEHAPILATPLAVNHYIASLLFLT